VTQAFKESLAAFTGSYHRVQDRIAVDFKQAFRATHAISFQKVAERHNLTVFRKPPAVSWSRGLIRERQVAAVATVALGAVSIEAEATGGTLATWAIHNEPPFFALAVRLE
jgi:hypothetical protein